MAPPSSRSDRAILRPAGRPAAERDHRDARRPRPCPARATAGRTVRGGLAASGRRARGGRVVRCGAAARDPGGDRPGARLVARDRAIRRARSGLPRRGRAVRRHRVRDASQRPSPGARGVDRRRRAHGPSGPAARTEGCGVHRHARRRDRGARGGARRRPRGANRNAFLKPARGEGEPMPEEIFPSSFRCDCGKRLDFFENTIKGMKRESKKRPWASAAADWVTATATERRSDSDRAPR